MLMKKKTCKHVQFRSGLNMLNFWQQKKRPKNGPNLLNFGTKKMGKKRAGACLPFSKIGLKLLNIDKVGLGHA